MLRKMDDMPCSFTNSSKDAVSGKKDTKSRLRYLLRVRSMRSYVSGKSRPVSNVTNRTGKSCWAMRSVNA